MVVAHLILTLVMKLIRSLMQLIALRSKVIFRQAAIFMILAFFLSACSKNEESIPADETSVQSTIGLIADQIDNTPVVIYANQEKGILKAFQQYNEFSGELLDLTLSDSGFPNILVDQHGNIWDIFGKGVSQENSGQELQTVEQLVGYWFSFPSFFENIDLHNGESLSGGPVTTEDDDWLINSSNVFYGSFRDGIRSIDAPKFIDDLGKAVVDNSFYSSLNEEEIVTVVQYDGITRVYPHRILEYHEIVNDAIGDYHYTLSYCPLTGTSRVWSRTLNGEVTEFGVSGLLFNNNLILYDRLTESNWSQILDLSIQGQLKGKEITPADILEVDITTAKFLNGRIELLDPNSGTGLDYGISPYEEYKSDDFVYFPLANRDSRIPAKERVIGVTVGTNTVVYRFSDFAR